MFKEFDFNGALFVSFPAEWQEFLKSAYRSGMNCSEFVEGALRLRQKKSGIKHSIKRKYNMYWWLQERYGFFSPSNA